MPVNLPSPEGRELRLTLAAYGTGRPVVEVEVLLTPGGLPLPVAALHPGTLVRAAEGLRRAAEGSPVPVPRQPA